jgi:hypothetical protein
LPVHSDLQYLLQFFAFFNCERIPKALFDRAKLPSPQWSDEGELEITSSGRYGLEALVFGQHNLANLIEIAERQEIVKTEGAPCFQWYIVSETWKERRACDLTSEEVKAIHFRILGIVSRAFPVPWTTLLWEEVEEQLREVIESTCLPFLGMLDKEDLIEYLSGAPR